MFSYRSLLRQAWNISWRYKYLWFFGLFASLTAAGGSIEYQILTQNLNQGLIDGSYYHLGNILALGELAKNFCLGMADLFQHDILTIINSFTLLLITAALLAVFIWLAISSQAALVDSTKKLLNSKKKNPVLSVRDGLATGHQNFWPVLGLNILIKILVSAAFFIISLPLLFLVLSDSSVLITIYTILFVIFLPIAVSLSLLVKYAIAFRVLENKSALVSLEKGWQLFSRNWLVSLEMAIILFIINFLGGLAALIVLAILFLPLFLVGLLFKITWLTVLMLLLGLIAIILVGSFLTTFQISTWTSLFIRLREKGGLAKLERVFQKKK